MARLPSSFWGPPPQWALIPLVAVGAVLGALAFRLPEEGNGPVAVTALKPLEVRYGVPSPQTAGLWPEPLPR